MAMNSTADNIAPNDGTAAALAARLRQFTEHLRPPELPVEGKLVQMTGLTLVASGCRAAVGSRCRVMGAAEDGIEAEVVGFSDGKLYLMPIGRIRGLKPGARVVPTHHRATVGTGWELLGRVIDGGGDPIDKQGTIGYREEAPLQGPPINPFTRAPIDRPLDVGIRAINALLTIGRGQRMGLFAGSGVGKSVLLGMMTRNTAADIVVVGLIGERGREVREFVDNILGPANLRKAVVVATPADDPPLMRLHGAWRATAIAEYFRDQGANVLLLMDSLTRFAQAQRELALAIGELPVTRGYPPSVFAQIPQLVERAGNGVAGTEGSITALYTVLAESDDHNDPVADATRAILDGHIVLSRELAEAGVYPAIDIEASISRVMPHIAQQSHINAALKFKQIYGTYRQNRDLISVGAYQPGSNPQIDRAVNLFPALQGFISQDSAEPAGFDASLCALHALHENTGQEEAQSA